MKKSLFLGTLLLLSLPLLSHADEWRGQSTMSQTQMEYIMKVNCDDYTGDAKNYCLEKKRQATLMQSMLAGTSNGTGVALPPPPREKREWRDMSRSPRDGSGTMIPRPPRDASGANLEKDTKGLMLAIGALSPADRETLIKMIKDYLVSKGVDPVKYAEKRDEIKEVRKDTREAVKDMRDAKRDEMKAKIRDLRSNGSGSWSTR